MTETLAEPRRPRREEDATAPFVLDRTSTRPPPAPDDLEPESIAHVEHDGEHDGVVHLVSRRSDPSERGETPHAPETTADEAAPSGDARALAAHLTEPRLDRAGRRAVRLLAWALAMDALVLLTLASISLGRLTREGAGAPDLLIGGVTLVLALPCLLGAQSAARIGRRGATPTTDAHRFAQSVGHLRALFVIKATVLFTTLGLGCFAFSLVASLLALL
jgi:hypothetical protein